MFDVEEIHGIGALQRNRVLIDSALLGWHEGYASYTAEAPWQATLGPVPHLCLAYCAQHVATVRRDVEGERPERTTLGPRHFGSVPAGRSTTFELHGHPDIQHVYLRQQMMDQLVVEMFGADPAEVDIVPDLGFADPLLEQLVLALLSVLRNQDGAEVRCADADGLYADHVLRMIGLHVLRTQSNLSLRARSASSRRGIAPTVVRLRAVRDHIDAALHGPLSLASIAAATGVPAHLLGPAFKECFGLSLHQYVIARRVERASTLLRDSDEPIASIAVGVGFASQSHLTTAFRRAVGTTPAAYRRDTR